MGNPKLLATEFLLSLGRPGLAGAVLLLAGLGHGLGVLLPEHQSVNGLQERAERAERRAGMMRVGSDGKPQVSLSPAETLYASLPRQEELAPQVERIYAAAAAEQLALLQGEYARTEVPGTRLVRYRVTLPVRGTYAQVRRFVAAATVAVPGLAIDDLNLQRKAVAEAQLEARVQFSVFLAGR
ncbi:MAG TPA: hypothetical protein VGD76_21835 [Ramlibacter sp.]